VVIYTRLNNRNPRELKYWLTGTVSTNVKLKLKDLMSRTKDTLEIQDVAEKMGLTKKEIFLELWNQSTKSTKEDFDILLETEDYHTIIAQIKNTLKKQSISFKEL
jgi:predicted regulator of amino acid metabolism with ACT domain